MPKKTKTPIIVDPVHELNKILEDENKCPDIIAFARDYLRLSLHPAQAFILKCLYNIELNAFNKIIRIPDKFNDKIKYKMTEKEFLSFLYNEGRTNIRYIDQILSPEMILVAGRRSGKTFLMGIVSTYEAYKLVYGYTNKSLYGLKDDSKVEIRAISNTEKQSENLFSEIRGNIARSRCFFNSIDRNPEGFMHLRTKKDREIFGDNGLTSLRIGLSGASARTQRGDTNIVAILDELAYFINKDSSRSCHEMYKAIKPSTATFGLDAKVVSISSAGGKEGKFYELYQQSLEENNKDLLMFKLPTWYINPTIPSNYLRREYRLDPSMYMVEYGSEFSSRVFGWIDKKEHVDKCVDISFPMLTRGKRSKKYYLGIDYAPSNNASALALVEKEDTNARLIYCEQFQSGKGKFETHDKIMPSDLAKIIKELSLRYYIYKGLADSYNAVGLEDALNNINIYGLVDFKLFNQRVKSMMWKFWRNLIIEERFYMYKEAILDQYEKNDNLVAEILSLQRRIVSKDIVLVEAPIARNKTHGDRADAINRAIWAAFHDEEDNEGHSDATIVSVRKTGVSRIRPKRMGRQGRLTSSYNLQLKHKRHVERKKR